jgi:hypothetical protein
MSWQDKFTFRDKRFTEHEVAGNVLRFYPNRLALLIEARDIATPVASAINTLFVDESKDSGSSVKRHQEGEGDDAFWMEDIKTEAITEEMATFRITQRKDAIETIMGTLADKRSLILLGRLFMDSLRDEFSYKIERPTSEVEEFLYGHEGADSEYQGLDTPVLVDLFRGWMKGNAKVFGAVGEQMVGLVKQRLEDLRDSNSETPDPTNGDSSKTPSQPQLVTDSPPSISTD